jgi:RNA polymerase sigma-70 factor (ECF subfamily)
MPNRPEIRHTSLASPAVTRSDGELLRAHLTGDRQAFAELADRHLPTLWAVARRTLNSREDAADAVQDALLHAHQAAASCRAEGSARTWLVRIVLNACLDRYRRNRARPSDPTPGTELERLAAHRDAIADHELRLDVESALAQLPFEQRVVIVLVDMHGYRTSEVADMLGVAVGTVKSRGWRGRLRLAELLGNLRATQTVGEQR